MPSLIDLDVPAEVAAGEPTDVLALAGKTVALGDVGTGTYQLQGSIDGVTYHDEGVALTADGRLEVSKTYAWLRWNVTAYTSGEPTSKVAGYQR